MLVLIQRLMFILHENKKRKLPLVFLMFVGVAVLDLVGIGVLPLLAPKLSSFTTSSQATDAAVGKKTLVMLVAAGLMLLFLFKVLVSYALQRYVIRFGQTVREDVIADLTKGYFASSFEETLRRNSFRSINLAGNGSTCVSGVLTNLLRICCDLISFAVILALMCYVDLWSTLALVASFAVFIVLYQRIVRHDLSHYGNMVNINSAELGQHLQQGLYAQKEIRLLGTARHFVAEAVTHARGIFAANVYIGSALIIPRLAIEFILINFAILFFVVRFVVMNDVEGSVAFIVALSAAGLRLFPGLTAMIGSLNAIRQMSWSIDQVHAELLHLREPPPALAPEARLASDFTRFQTLTVSNVDYRYPGAEAPVLQQISLSITRGEVVGLIGRSGAGKSTLADVLMGFLPPSAGSVSVDGVDIFADPSVWMSQIGYVPQSLNILDSSVLKNVALGVPESQIDRAAVLAALEEAQLPALADAIREGRDAPLGERGASLSGGQKQRLAIARALYFKRQVLVMDEATSALDNETEKAVMDSIRALRGKVTIILIAHRYSTLAVCDSIYEFDAGRLIAKLSYQDVKARIE